MSIINNFPLIKFKFSRPSINELSALTTSFISEIHLVDEIDVYFEVFDSKDENQVGWALIPQRKIYIRPTESIEEFELRLVHELTHIALADQGYKLITYYGEESLGPVFANLLHHIVLYPRLVAGGYSLEQDTKMVMTDLTKKIQVYKEICVSHGKEGRAYSIINLLNDLIRIDPIKKEDYHLEANKLIPELMAQAIFTLSKLNFGDSQLTIAEYEQNKIILEDILGIGKYHWIDDISLFKNDD